MTRPDPLDDFLDGLRRDPGAAPDQTRSIMGRLGYTRLADQVAVRRRRWRRLRRGGLVVIALGLVGLGLHLHQRGPDARRSGPAAMGPALEQQFEQRGADLGRVLELLDTWTPPAEPDAGAADESAPIDEDVDRSAMAAVRWS